VGPRPYSDAAAKQKVGALLGKIEPVNRDQTIKTLEDLLVWYRELIDEEIVAAWKKDNKANLTELIEKLADERVAAGVVEASWRQQRALTFSPAYEPLLEHLMYRYPDSAKPFLEDLLAPAPPDLSAPEAEAVCRILLHMPDIRTWRKDAARILPRYQASAERMASLDAGPVYNIGNGVSMPALLQQRVAGYSALGLKLHAQGSVIVNLVVERDGTVTDARVVRSVGYGLDERAVAAVHTWRFNPGTKDGKPVRVRINGEVRFPGVAAAWCSGPITFESKPGLTPPAVMDGEMPNADPEHARANPNERAAFQFKVDPSGAVTDIRPSLGSETAAALLTPYLAKWKFTPAMQNGQPVEAAGTLNFQMGPAPQTVSQVKPPPVPAGGQSVSGTLRRLEGKDLLLQTAANKVLRFRLTLKTEFHGADGRPSRDSLLNPGDRLTVQVDRADLETATYVSLYQAGTASDRQAASAPVGAAEIFSPQPGDFSPNRPSLKLDNPLGDGFRLQEKQ
jgi:TonB family protein